MIEAANIRPYFGGRDSVDADELRHVSEPCVIFEATWLDSDGVRIYAYTVGGWLRGAPLGGLQGGVKVGGDVILITANDRHAADMIASHGLQSTIDALNDEEANYIDAQAALARLNIAGPVRRFELATAAPADRSDAYEADQSKIRQLRGDDLLLSAGMADEVKH